MRPSSFIQVIKCNPSSQSRGRVKPPQPTDKPRVLCVTVERRVGSRGFKATLHICKGEPGSYELRKSFRLRLFSKLQAFGPPLSTQPLLEVTLASRGFTSGDSKLAFEAASDVDRAEILGLLYSFCKSHEQRSPLLLGIRKKELGSYGEELDEEDEDADDTITEVSETTEIAEISPRKSEGGSIEVSPTKMRSPRRHSPSKSSTKKAARQLNLPDPERSVSIPDAEMGAAWSAKQDAQLAGLVDAVAGGEASLGEVRSRLVAEQAALEDANVHELLESAAAAGVIENEIGATLGFVDDLEEALQMFDAKLRHMREDMAAIEEWNNRLETHSRNNLRLLTSLESMASALALDPATEDALRSAAWDAPGMALGGALEHAVAAAWDLHSHLQAVSTMQASSSAKGSGTPTPPPRHISTQMQKMKVVQARRRYMQELANEFLQRANDYLGREYSHIADVIVASMASQAGGDRLRPPPHATVHARATQLKPLLDVVTALRPAAAGALHAQYAKAINALLKREIVGAVKELQRQMTMMGSSSSSGMESDFSMRTVDSIRALERLHISPDPSGNSISSFVSPTRSRSGHHRRGSESAGTGSRELGRAIEDSFDALIGNFFPVMTKEVEKCLELVCGGVSEDNPTGRAATYALLLSIPEAIFGFLESVKPPKVLPVFGMVGTTLHWQAKLRGRPGSVAVCDILRQCEQKLRGIWAEYIASSVAAIQAFDPKSAMSGSNARAVHVLPFVVLFESVADKLETSIADWTQRDGPLPSSNNPMGSSTAVGGLPPRVPSNLSLPGSNNITPTTGLLPVSPFQSTPGSIQSTAVKTGGALTTPTNGPTESGGKNVVFPSDGSSPVGAMLIRPSAAVRAMADVLYAQILDAMQLAIESHASMNPKHGPRVKLENYSFLRLSLQGLPLAQAPVLQKKWQEAASLRNVALAANVEQQLEVLKLDRLVQLGGQLAEMAASGLGPAEAKARLAWSAIEARQAIAAANAGLDKRMQTARQKLQKHLGSSSPYLVDVVWDRVEVRCVQGWEELEQRLRVVFPGVVVAPSTDGLRAAFAAAKAGSP